MSHLPALIAAAHLNPSDRTALSALATDLHRAGYIKPDMGWLVLPTKIIFAPGPASPDHHSLVGGELSGAILFSGGNLLIGDAACGSTRYTLGCITNASVSFLSICFPQAEDQCLSRAKLRCCLSKHPAASVYGRGRRLGGVRR